MRSITTLDLQYAHRFYGFKGEAQYLHGHTGVLTIEVEDTIEPGVNMVFPCNEIQKTAWSVLKNFDHALILREDDPLLPAVLKVYEEQGIRDGAPQNHHHGPVGTSSRLCPCKHQDHLHHGRMADRKGSYPDKGKGIGKVAQQNFKQFKDPLGDEHTHPAFDLL